MGGYVGTEPPILILLNDDCDGGDLCNAIQGHGIGELEAAALGSGALVIVVTYSIQRHAVGAIRTNGIAAYRWRGCRSQ